MWALETWGGSNPTFHPCFLPCLIVRKLPIFSFCILGPFADIYSMICIWQEDQHSCVVFCEWWEYFWLINPTILKGRKPIYICIDMNYSAETGLLRLLFHVEFWVFFPFLLFYKTKPLCQTSKTMKRAKFKQKRV